MSESTGKRRGRKPSIVNLEEKAAKLARSIDKHERLKTEQEAELRKVQERIEELNSPEHRDELKALLESKRKELERLAARLGEDSPETEDDSETEDDFETEDDSEEL